MLEIIVNNIKYRLGKNAIENFKLIDDAVELNDNFWWFHLNDYPSGHCVIYNEDIEKHMLIYANDSRKYAKICRQMHKISE